MKAEKKKTMRTSLRIWKWGIQIGLGNFELNLTPCNLLGCDFKDVGGAGCPLGSTKCSRLVQECTRSGVSHYRTEDCQNHCYNPECLPDGMRCFHEI
jgi:hypothetical protein